MTEWFLSERDLDAIALGVGLLGAGGGGNTYLGRLRARTQLRAGRRIRIIPPEALKEDDLVIPVGGIGAPTVGIEKIEKGGECYRAVRAIEKAIGQPATALMAVEIGGANAMEPMIAAALADLPVVDADGMGRAFPEVQMCTFFIYGLKPSPGALCDEKGNTVVFTEVQSAQWLERLARAETVAMGCTAGFALPPLTGQQVRAWGVNYTVSQAWRLGQMMMRARAERHDPLAAILDQACGTLLFQGRIAEVARWTAEGFARGHLEIEGVAEYAQKTLQIEFQNEHLIAREHSAVIASVPDLISLVDSDTGRPISTEETRYGLRVSVLGLPCTPLLRTAQALAVVGPRAFGYDVDYHPLGDSAMPHPVAIP
jgi:DUF917 family protein